MASTEFTERWGPEEEPSILAAVELAQQESTARRLTKSDMTSSHGAPPKRAKRETVTAAVKPDIGHALHLHAKVEHVTLVSGGAEGADAVWTLAGLDAGFKLQVMTFTGHKARVPPRAIATLLTDADKQAADTALIVAAGRLGRRLSLTRNVYVANLLRRNYRIVRNAEALFAVGTLEHEKTASLSVNVAGGTGWACQLFADAQKSCQSKLNMFLFDQRSQRWHQCVVGLGRCFSWSRISAPSALSCTWSRVAVVGTRKLTAEGRLAIQSAVSAWRVCEDTD